MVYEASLYFDKTFKTFVVVQIRNYIDWGTLSKVYYSKSNSISKLKVYGSLINFYNEILYSSKTQLIIDLGANNGILVRYFSDSFPLAKIVAFEPDDLNYNLAVINNSTGNIDWFKKAIGSSRIWKTY